MSVEKRVAAYLDLAGKDVHAAELLMAGGNRYAAYHLQQAIEKLTKALLLAKGIEAGIEHRLEELFKRFAGDDEIVIVLHERSAFFGNSSSDAALIRLRATARSRRIASAGGSAGIRPPGVG